MKVIMKCVLEIVDVDVYVYIFLRGDVLTQKRKSIRLGKKVIKVPENIYFKLNEGARKQKLPMVDYIDALIIKYETEGVKRDIARHITSLDNLLTQYVDETFNDVFTFLRIILMRSGQLDKKGRKAFLKNLAIQLEEAEKSMSNYLNYKGEVK